MSSHSTFGSIYTWNPLDTDDEFEEDQTTEEEEEEEDVEVEQDNEAQEINKISSTTTTVGIRKGGLNRIGVSCEAISLLYHSLFMKLGRIQGCWIVGSCAVMLADTILSLPSQSTSQSSASSPQITCAPSKLLYLERRTDDKKSIASVRLRDIDIVVQANQYPAVANLLKHVMADNDEIDIGISDSFVTLPAHLRGHDILNIAHCELPIAGKESDMQNPMLTVLLANYLSKWGVTPEQAGKLTIPVDIVVVCPPAGNVDKTPKPQSLLGPLCFPGSTVRNFAVRACEGDTSTLSVACLRWPLPSAPIDKRLETTLSNLLQACKHLRWVLRQQFADDNDGTHTFHGCVYQRDLLRDHIGLQHIHGANTPMGALANILQNRRSFPNMVYFPILHHFKVSQLCIPTIQSILTCLRRHPLFANNSVSDSASNMFEDVQESVCPLCQDHMCHDGTYVSVLPCGHLMHTACFLDELEKTLCMDFHEFRRISAALASQSDDTAIASGFMDKCFLCRKTLGVVEVMCHGGTTNNSDYSKCQLSTMPLPAWHGLVAAEFLIHNNNNNNSFGSSTVKE